MFDAQSFHATMGIQAIMIYDAVARRPLVLRTSSPGGHMLAVETLGSFTQHVAAVVGIAKTPVEVSALWGGPPNVNYVVVAHRYRVMLVWSDTACDIGVALEASTSLRKVSSSVESVTQALSRGRADAIAYIYNASGTALGRINALGTADPVDIEKRAKAGDGLRGLIKRSSSSLRGLPMTSSRFKDGLTTSFSSGQKAELQISGKRGLAGLFGKRDKATKARLSSRKSFPLEQKEGLLGAERGSGVSATSIPDTELLVRLPDEMFQRADFGGPLPASAGGLSWFVDLFHESEMVEKPIQPATIVPLLKGKLHAGSRDLEATQTQAPSLLGSTSKAVPSEKPPSSHEHEPQVLHQTTLSENHAPKPSQGTETISGSEDINDPIASGEEIHTEDSIRARMNGFARAMQAGNFQEALEKVEAALEVLAVTAPLHNKEILVCANYKIAQKILIRVRAIDEELSSLIAQNPNYERRKVEAAVLTMVLASLKGLLPRHQIAATKMAVEKNMMVGNYGVCAGWLRNLIKKAPTTHRQQFADQLQLCISNNNANSRMPPYNRLCYLTLSLIPPPVLKCAFCPATYNPRLSGVVVDQMCPTCRVSKVSMLP